jgi:peptide/nickel transport system substrate-binding protein
VAGNRGGLLFVLILIGGVLALVLTWQAGREREAARGPEERKAFGGTYVEGMAGAPGRVNPLFARLNEADLTLTSLVFSGLTRLDNQGAPFPDLAETWQTSADGRVWTFRLRDRLLWQDGRPLTADDVLFTYRIVQDPALRYPPALAAVLADAKLVKVDPRTLTIELPQAFAPLPAYLTLGILPQHLLANIPIADLYDTPFNARPLGSGPYRLDEVTPARAVLSANPSYHLGPPYVQRLELRFFNDDGAVYAALRSGALQGAYFAGGLGHDAQVWVAQQKELRRAQLATNQIVFVYLNLRNPVLQDRRVRQALLYAVNRDAIIEDAVRGAALRADSPLLPGNWADTGALKRYNADVAAATALLDDAGFKLNAQGVRFRGADMLQFSLVTNNDPERLAVAQAVAQRWTALGARVNVIPSGTTALVRDLLQPRAYEAALYGDIAGPDPDPFPRWHSTQTGPRGANLTNLAEPRFDRVLDEARGPVAPARRKELYAQFQELFAQEVPALPLYVPAAVYVQTSALAGVNVGLLMDSGSRFWQVQEWNLANSAIR